MRPASSEGRAARCRCPIERPTGREAWRHIRARYASRPLSAAVAHFDLFRILVVREVRTRYARTVLGVAWAVFPPLLAAAVFTVIDLGRLIGGDSPWKDVPYPAFAFSGLVF